MPRLKPEVGDIWKYDTSKLYAGNGYGRCEHWLIVDSCYVVDHPEYTVARFRNNKDYFLQYIHLETGKVETKIFYSREWGEELDLYGNPYYKKVA